jgi:predicted Zn-dependent peptidase
MLESTLGSWKTKKGAEVDWRATRDPRDRDVLYLVDKPGAVQSVVTIGRTVAVRRHEPKYFDALLANRIVGGDFLSRLNQNLREKNGYTYGCYSSLSYYSDHSTVWSLQTSVRADATAAAVREALGEFAALSGDRPIADEEFQVNREAELRAFPESFEDPSGIASALEETALFKLPAEHLQKFQTTLGKVSQSDAQNAAVQWAAPKQCFVLVVGDRRTIEPDLKKLSFRRILVLSTNGKQLEPPPAEAKSPLGESDAIP